MCAQNALFLHRADDAWKILRKQKSGWQEVEWEGGPNPIQLYTRALNEAETLREKFMNHYDSEDLAGFMLSCMEKEHDRVLYHLKEDIGIEYLPVELLRDAIGDHPEQIGLDWEKNGADIRALCYARFQNLYHKNQPTYLTITRRGMERFAKTGRLSDHVACFSFLHPGRTKMDFGIYLLSGGNSSFVFHPLFEKRPGFAHDAGGHRRRRADYLSHKRQLSLVRTLSGSFCDGQEDSRILQSVLRQRFVEGMDGKSRRRPSGDSDK